MLIFAWRECCLLLLFATVVITATLAHVGLFFLKKQILFPFFFLLEMNRMITEISLCCVVIHSPDKVMINHVQFINKIINLFLFYLFNFQNLKLNWKIILHSFDMIIYQANFSGIFHLLLNIFGALLCYPLWLPVYELLRGLLCGLLGHYIFIKSEII